MVGEDGLRSPGAVQVGERAAERANLTAAAMPNLCNSPQQSALQGPPHVSPTANLPGDTIIVPTLQRRKGRYVAELDQAHPAIRP